jgi:hypothetical protein
MVEYDRLIAMLPDVARKGATIPYTSLNGHMFSFLTDSGTLALRLPADVRDEFLERFGTNLHEAHGIVMKEYVSVPPSLLADAGRLSPYFRESHAYVATLKPKPTRQRS